MSQSVTAAVAKRENGPAALIAQYTSDFATVLPSHIKPDTWVRLAQGALRRDEKLAQAAQNDSGALLAALLDAARKGLEPGTEEYYLVPRKQKGVFKVQGIEGYQGIIERMYRAGAISSVVVEVVRSNDTFRYVPGRDERPVHEIDWFAGNNGRGELVGVYAYAVMKDGATSKVVVLNRDHVMEAKAKSDGADSPYSPWQNHEEAMWLKTAARRLSKWVPTSAEYRREQLRAAVEADNLRAPRASAASAGPALEEPVDAEIVGEHDPDAEAAAQAGVSWPDPARPGGE